MVQWGDLDVLLLDMPPGTGDVHLAICQELQLSGAVSVTTPSKLAVTDARKGIEMFTSLGVHTLAAVENMAYFVVRKLVLIHWSYIRGVGYMCIIIDTSNHVANLTTFLCFYHVLLSEWKQV